ncbi:MAG: hypothetical protein RBU30_00965 [Polyangia bacterium]|jgi:hypothetical protein|nr:hypothetical protein [Polyangia bacterium]
MAQRPKSPVQGYGGDYPSLAEHQQSRRAFLGAGLCVAGAGALAAGCPGFFTGQIQGSIAEPTWARIRFPRDPDEQGVYLIDNGYAEFHAVAVTYTEDVAIFAQDQHPALLARLVTALSESTYEDLRTSAGVSAAAERMRAVLDAAYNEDTGDIGENWFEWVELTISRLDAPVEIGGVMPEPSYP